ncbi:MAG: hypothetical protein GX138_00315 [Firmicutes bacterium]|jgi:hypothetical protein|nr:hypothetical protein [Bacillota bacterium]
MQISTSFAVWLTAGMTLAIYSGVYKENPIYRLVEHIYVGVSAGNGIVSTIDNYAKPTITIDIFQNGTYSYLIPILIGLLVYTRFSKNRNINWLNRIPLAFWVGIGSAVVLTKNFKANFISQVTATFMPMINNDPLIMVNNIVMVVGVLSVLSYFFFSFELPKGLNVFPKFGRYIMMIGFGAAYGNTVLSRMSVLLGRLQFLLGNWLGIIETRI